MKTLAAILRDPNPIHWDQEEVVRRGLGNRVINQGPTNLGYVMNMLMAWAGQDCLEQINVRFTATVEEGDHGDRRRNRHRRRRRNQTSTMRSVAGSSRRHPGRSR